MPDKTVTNNSENNYKFVIITLDAHSAGPVNRVQKKLKPYFPSLEISVLSVRIYVIKPTVSPSISIP